jgi:hypothetical protein
MAVFNVSFAQWYHYEIEAETLEKAIEQAEEEFVSDMRDPVANISWNEMVVYDENDEEELAHEYM